MEDKSQKSLPPASICPYLPEKDTASNVRGSLKLEASTSTPLTLAGEEISIYVVIRNPFLVPVIIYSTETHIPVSLVDELGIKRARKQLKEKRKNQISTIGKEEKSIDSNYQAEKSADLIIKNNLNGNNYFIIELLKVILRIKFILSDIFKPFIHFFKPNTGDRVAIAVSPEEEAQISSDGDVNNAVDFYGNLNGMMQIILPVKGRVSIYGNVDGTLQVASIADSDISTSPDKKILNKRDGIILQPGDSLVKHFVLKTTKWLFFPPINHTFQIQVRYEVDEKLHIDTLPFSINIRAPMRSSIVGALIGGFFGYLARDSNNLSALLTLNRELLIGLLRTIIFSLIVIVAFARKSSVQQVVSVEDFWGGVFTGFLVGYTGEEFIKSILGNNTPLSK